IEHFPLNLSCSAYSNPPANYSWYHNEKLLEAQNESQLLISHLSLNDAGKYTCNATNDVTGLFSHTSLEISVLGDFSSSGQIQFLVLESLCLLPDFWTHTTFFLSMKTPR
uniref:Ig-like domain-containing protein n=1 Tax=Podarcis muralis TaxID=64176 RepID=A0A670IJM4_PODMU